MISQSTPTVKNKWPFFSLKFFVVEKYMVQPKSISQFRFVFGDHPLLPVEPPKVDSRIFMRAQDIFEKSLVKIFLFYIPGYCLVGGQTKVGSQSGIIILIPSYTIGRMKVQCGFQVLRMKPADKFRWFGNRTRDTCGVG